MTSLFAVWQTSSLLIGLLLGLTLGLLAGVVFGWAMAKRLRVARVSARMREPSKLKTQLEEALIGLHYECSGRTDSLWSFKPKLRAGIATGRITIAFGADEVTLVGPAANIDKCLGLVLGQLEGVRVE